MTNPRYANGTLRRKHRARLKAMGCSCGICGGAIHYDEPSDAQHPLSFVVDEIHPVSRWREFGYQSPRAAAEPAQTAGYNEVAKMVHGTKNSPPLLQSGVSRLVKQAGADTTLKNALRDGAEWA